MNFKKSGRNNCFVQKVKKYIFSVSVVLLVIIVICAIYLGDFYRADMEKISGFTCNNEVRQTEEKGYIVLEADEAEKGFIFYPGGKVEYTAYIPLMKALASEGTLCILVEMPYNLAVLDTNAADGLQEKYPQIEEWYIGGHSLGGSMAASYVSEHADSFEGLVLLGAYSTADLSDTELDVLSVYGSEDLVMNREKYESNTVNLPADFVEVVIEGGCHAYFGMYGAQEGDGTPEITQEEQIYLTAEAICAELFE